LNANTAYCGIIKTFNNRLEVELINLLVLLVFNIEPGLGLVKWGTGTGLMSYDLGFV